jgi:hypothetical protein
MEFSSDPLYSDFFKHKDTSAEEKSEQKFRNKVHSIYTLLAIGVLIIVDNWVPGDPNTECPDK